MRIRLFLISILLFPWSCEIPVDPVPGGRLQYKAFDSTGTLLVQGWMTLDTADSSRVTGEWHFEKVGDPQDIGPQVGEGRLEGAWYNSVLSVNLNPNFADNNVYLTGKLEKNRFSGRWMWTGFPGRLNEGDFIAS